MARRRREEHPEPEALTSSERYVRYWAEAAAFGRLPNSGSCNPVPLSAMGLDHSFKGGNGGSICIALYHADGKPYDDACDIPPRPTSAWDAVRPLQPGETRHDSSGNSVHQHVSHGRCSCGAPIGICWLCEGVHDTDSMIANICPDEHCSDCKMPVGLAGATDFEGVRRCEYCHQLAELMSERLIALHREAAVMRSGFWTSHAWTLVSCVCAGLCLVWHDVLSGLGAGGTALIGALLGRQLSKASRARKAAIPGKRRRV